MFLDQKKEETFKGAKVCHISFQASQSPERGGIDEEQKGKSFKY